MATIAVLRFANEKVQEHRGAMDQMAMMRQLGALAAYGPRRPQGRDPLLRQQVDRRFRAGARRVHSA